MERLVVIHNQGQRMFGNLHLPREGVPCVLLSHGLESSKDGNKWLTMSPRLYEAGFASLRFSYRGCGEGDERSDGKFEDTTLTARISDYRAAIDFLHRVKVNVARIGLMGSSLGGMVALTAGDERIKAMVTLGTPFSLPFLARSELTSGENKDYINLNSGKRLRMAFLEDLSQYNIGHAIKKIHCPLLIIHGALDELVPVEDAYKLCSYANEPKQLEIIDGANHRFDNPEHLERVVKLGIDWFKRYL